MFNQSEDNIRNAQNAIDDILRKLYNSIWLRGGVEAVHQIEKEVRTCNNCGHVAEDVLINCPICGYTRL